MTPGPDYYRLADGRQFYEYSWDVIIPYCDGIETRFVCCIVSASEHYFRMGAKEGEAETDWKAVEWWCSHLDEQGLAIWSFIRRNLDHEREKVGR